MSKALIRITDLYTNATANGATVPIQANGSTTLNVGGLPVYEMHTPLAPLPDQTIPPFNTVFHNGQPLVGQTDQTVQSGVFVLGDLTTTIG